MQSAKLLLSSLTIITLSLLSFSTTHAYETTNLVAAYNFDQGTGTTLTDFSNYNNHGVLTNGPTWISTGKFGKALKFDGSNDLVVVNDSNSLDLTNSMTIEAWVYPTTNMSGYDTLVMKEKPNSMEYALYANSQSSNKPSVYLTENESEIGLEGGTKLATNTWTHLATTYDGSQIKLYKNGILVASQPYSGIMNTSSGRLTIGGNFIWTNEDFAGRIDNLRIYNVALTANEILSNMNTPITSTPSPSATPTPTSTPLPTSTPIPTPLPTATPAPTLIPTSTPIPTVTPTTLPTPTVTPTPLPTSTPTPTLIPTPTPNSGILTGLPFGLTPAYSTGAEFDKAWDNNTSTYYDYLNPNGGYTGLDLGSSNSAIIDSIKYYPRSGWAARMVGGKFQGSNTSSSNGYIDLHTITSTPPYAWTQVNFINTTAYRYVRYLSPSNSYGNVAEIQLLASGSTPAPSPTPTPSPTPIISTFYPLKISTSSVRYLEDKNNRPFFINGDSPWSLISQLSREDVDIYLQDAVAKGINSILVELVDTTYADNAPANFYNQPPFLTPGKFNTPNPDYFAHADWVISKAAEYNINVLLAPLYLGCCDDGWYATLDNNSITDMEYYGNFIGNRYKSFPNLIYAWGGDTNPCGYKSTTQNCSQKDKVRAMINTAYTADPNHLHTFHATPEFSSFDVWDEQDLNSWLKFNSTYTYNPVQTEVLKDYNQSPSSPFFLFESHYESDWANANAAQVRKQAYSSILSGASGHNVGNNPIWHFNGRPGDTCTGCWKDHLNDEGRIFLPVIRNLFLSRNWTSLTPDQYHLTVLNGFADPQNYIAAALTANTETLIAYLPSTQNTITVDMSRISGAISNIWWFNPANGQVTSAGSQLNLGQQTFTTPTTGNDWVLVIDDQNYNFPAPGTSVYTP